MSVTKQVKRSSAKWGVPEWLLKRQIRQESGGNPNAVSPAGARGIAQFIDSTARAYGVNTRDGRTADDIEGMAHYMHDNLERTGGDVKGALSIYNSGRPEGYKSIPETKNYVASILGGRSGNVGSSAGGGTGLELERGATTMRVPDRELQRQQFFAQWFAQRNPTSPLVKLGVVDPEMATTRKVKVPTITGFKATATSAGGRHPVTGRPGGSYAGTTGLITGFSRDAHRFNLRTSSGKRDTVMTASGNVSDHAKVSTQANARDWSGEVADMDRYAKHLQQRLGLRDWKGVQTATKQIGDHVYRFQMLYRTNVGGDHFGHLHLGVRRVS